MTKDFQKTLFDQTFWGLCHLDALYWSVCPSIPVISGRLHFLVFWGGLLIFGMMVENFKVICSIQWFFTVNCDHKVTFLLFEWQICDWALTVFSFEVGIWYLACSLIKGACHVSWLGTCDPTVPLRFFYWQIPVWA